MECEMRKNSGCSVKKIAEATGFNISTVSRALNNHPKISAQTVAAILKTAEELGYCPHPHRKAIAVILPPCRTRLYYYSTNLLNALRLHAAERNYLLDIISSDQTELLNERSVTGVISFDFNNYMAKRIGSSSNLPMICINDSARHIEGVYSVFSDELGAVKQAVAHLAGYGHTKIAMLTNGDSATACNLSRRKAFEEMKILYDLDPVSAWHPGLSMNDRGKNIKLLYGTIAKLAESGVTALISTGESESLFSFHSVSCCGLKIPEEMSLITWEMPDISEYLPIPLTTFQQNFSKLATEALNLLEALIEGRPVNSDITVDYLFHDRDSVALPRDLKIR